MSIFEYDEERHLAYILEKGRREGRKEERNHSIADEFEMLLKFGAGEEEAISAICEQKGIRPEEVREILLSRS